MQVHLRQNNNNSYEENLNSLFTPQMGFSNPYSIVQQSLHNREQYEDEQLQIIIMNEIKEKSLKEAQLLKDRSLQEERTLRELQDIEYQESLEIDLTKLNKELNLKEDLNEEISLEEMREIRLQRFS